MYRRVKSDEAPEEGVTTKKDTFLDIKCNINSTTNYMMQGISEVRWTGVECCERR